MSTGYNNSSRRFSTDTARSEPTDGLNGETRRSDPQAPPPEDEDLTFIGLFRKQCGLVVNNDIVQLVLLLFIVVNAVVMALLTFDFIDDNPGVKFALETVDKVLLIVFTVESGLQLMHYGFGIIHHSMHLLDMAIVIISWLVASVQALRSLRIFRTLRLFQKVESLRTLLQAMIDVIPNISAISCFLLLIFYVFGVMFTDLFGKVSREDMDTNYFGSLWLTMFSLFQFTTLDWIDAARQTQPYYSWAPIFITFFAYLSGFVIFNLFVAVLCNALLDLDEEEEKEKDLKRIERVTRMHQLTKDLIAEQSKIQETLATLSETNERQ